MVAPMMAPDHPARRVARALLEHPGGFVVVAHVDPDGDALGSVLTLARALRRLDRAVVAPMGDPPRFLRFLFEPDELCEPLAARPADALVVVLDGDVGRAAGVPLVGGQGVVNVDHHASNAATAEVAWVDPSYASASMMVAEVVDALGVAWDERLATPCLAGLMTDTGHFRFGNTDRRALEAAGRLIEAGVAYADLADRLQWRHPDYFRMLALVMATVRFRADGDIVLADQTVAMRDAIGDGVDDADDFVGQIRYAEGARLAAVLKERPGAIKVSLRSRGGVSARRICQDLGGGGHDAAAGATLADVSLAEAEERLLEAATKELRRAGPTPEQT
jgi:bifunctional oligoribonuclease and PAP phosphatase NrnA